LEEDVIPKSVLNLVFYRQNFFLIFIPFLSIFPAPTFVFGLFSQTRKNPSSGAHLSVSVSPAVGLPLVEHGGGNRSAELPV
jgi:hypothetical protein